MTVRGARLASRRRADAILARALELPPTARREHVERACGADVELRSRVARLLRWAETEDPFLTEGGALRGGLGDALADESPASAAAPAGTRIGPWRIARELGRGGMAVVYLAARADGAYEQQVALKLLQAGPQAADLVRRFERERQILASLQHPHIAGLIDGGLTDDGQPWFAMEYVEGLPVDRYCDERRLTVDERLELFIQIARAVQAAHRALVVHRDLKPSNILVTEEGFPRLLDFGIAKPLDPEAGADAETRTLLMLTPEYATPEQLRGWPVTTASDVYQLGLLLHELLTGVRAQRVLGRSAVELERVILEQAPSPPSAASGTGEAAAARAEARRITLPELARRLRGDLDAIVSQALRKEPERRYGSAAEMAEDVRRHLAALPVTARPDSLRYRAGKFVRRHVLGVAAAAGVAALISTLVTFYTVRLQKERDQARIEALKAEQVADFLVGIFESANPDRALGEEITARQLLDRGVQMAEELDAEPEVQARMLEVMGFTYRRLELHAEAQTLLERALAARLALFGARHPDVARSHHELGGLLVDKREFVAAEEHLLRAARLRRALLGPRDPELATTIDKLARVYRNTDRFERAETLFREALEIRLQALGTDHEDTATSHIDLGLLLFDRDDLEGAEWHMRQGLAIYRKVLGDRHPWIAIALNNLALPLLDKAEFAEAEALLREAVELDRKLLEEDSAVLANRLYNLAVAVHGQRRYADADRIISEGLAIARRKVDDSHPLLFRLLLQRGETYLESGRFVDAEASLREAIDVGRRAFAEDHWRVTYATNLLGASLAAQGELAQAESLLLESHTALQSSLARDTFKRRATQRLIEFYEATDQSERAAQVRATFVKSVP